MTGNQSTAAKKFEVPRELSEKLVRGEITLGEFLGLKPSALYQIATLGHQMLTTGKLEHALTIFKGLVQASPYDSVFHCNLGATLYAMGEHEEAVKSYTNALKFNRANADALAGRGELYLRMNRIADGIADLKAAIEADPKGTRAATVRARATLGMLKQAVEKQRSGEKPALKAEAKPAAKAPAAEQKPAAAKASAPAAKPAAKTPAKK